jgi:hypothetical protein
MCWLPEHDLGVVALGNVRYATTRLAATKALLQLVQQKTARPRRSEPAAPLKAARAGVYRLLNRWDDALADQLFADNFFLDDSRAWWQAEMARLAAVHGKLQDSGPFEAENALRGTWKLTGERGWVNTLVTLTPTVPPRVQKLALESVLPPGPALARALEELIKLLNRPSQHGTNRLFTEKAKAAPDQHTFFDKIRIVAALCGECKLGRILAGDGEGWIRLLLEGTKGTVEAVLRLGPDKQKFLAGQFRQVR